MASCPFPDKADDNLKLTSLQLREIDLNGLPSLGQFVRDAARRVVSGPGRQAQAGAHQQQRK